METSKWEWNQPHLAQGYIYTHITNDAGQSLDNVLVWGVYNTPSVDLNDLMSHTYPTSVGNGASC